MHRSALFISIVINCVCAQPKLLSNSVTVKSGSAFTQYVIPGEGERVKACLLEYEYGDRIFKIGLQLDGIQKFDNGDIQSRLSNIGRNACGFTLHAFTKKDENTYKLLVDYEDEAESGKIKSITLAFEAFTAGHTDTYPLENATTVVSLSESPVITCSDRIEHKVYACRLYNPKGELVKQEVSCDYKIQYVSMDDIGTWKCSLSLLKSMKTFEKYTTLVLKDSPQVETWYRVENMRGMIGCKYINNYGSPLYPLETCLLIDPQNNVYSMSDVFAATDRYTSLGTDLKNYTCQIEFPVPILSSEKGIWKCVVGSSGGFINTNLSNTKIVLKDQIQYGVLGSELEIKCYAPFSADSCIIIAPTGEVFYGGTPEKFHLGECGTKVAKLNASYVGTWSCRFSRADSAVDDVIKIEVRSGDVGTGFAEVEVSSGESAELKCKFGAPIQFCSFIDPLGNSYNVSPKKKSSTVEYIGDGLDRGDCGMKISNIRSNQGGEWKCVAANARSTVLLEWKTKMIVNSNVAATATAIGIPVGIMSVAVVLLGAGLCKRFGNFKRRKHKTSDTSNSSLPFTDDLNVQRYT